MADSIAKQIMADMQPENMETHSLKPHYECSAKGVFHIGVKDGDYMPPVRLSAAIRLIGRGVDGEGQHYRIIEWKDGNTAKREALPMADIGTMRGWQKLQGMGIFIHAGRKERERLANYLQEEGSKEQWTIANKAGWHGDAYILPSGEVVAPKDERIIYTGDTREAANHQAKGSLQDWQQHIARLAAGNSRLTLALGTAFAAPLLSLLDMENGGFHLYGDSSDGKTTSAKLALTVWGNPSGTITTWGGTAHAFSNIAATRNDGLLVLDEIGQADRKAVYHTAYSIANGIGKLQGHKEGGNRITPRWRALLLSTGEKTLEGYLNSQDGNRWQAGQANRLPDIPANAGKGYGVFDLLHEFESGAALAEHLNHAGNLYHGTAGRAFIDLLQKDPTAKERAKAIMQDFTDSLPPLEGQPRRVAKRFALVAAALELAAEITGIAPILTRESIRQCFNDWHAINGSGKREDKRIIEHMKDFMQISILSHRFVDKNTTETSLNPAGYKTASDDYEDVEYWILTPVFKQEICKDYEARKVCEVLHAANWLKLGKASQGFRTRKRTSRGLQWVYVFAGHSPPEDEPSE